MSRPFIARIMLLSCIAGLAPYISHAQTYSESVLYDFCSQADCADGYYAWGPLVQAADGNFYGTTSYGGANADAVCDANTVGGCGTIFRVTPAGVLTTLHSFCSQANCSDGANPIMGLVQGGDGNLYGITAGGGLSSCFQSSTCGTAFRITPSGVFTVLDNLTDPSGDLVEGSDGNFYGTTYGQNSFDGDVFRMTPSGTITSLYNFCSLANCADGDSPLEGVTQGNDGSFYGSTYGGGVNNNNSGTLFRLTSSGVLSTYSLNGDADGFSVSSPLIEGSDGSFYGSTYTQGAHDGGTFFKIDASGTFSTLYAFCLTFSCTGQNYHPGFLTLASDGNFYGGTSFGVNTTCENGMEADCYNCQNSSCGEAFRMTPAGTISQVYAFCGEANCADGGNPTGMIQASDGNFYGTTITGGGTGTICNAGGDGDGGGDWLCGTIFKIAVDPQLPAPVQLTLSSSSVAAGKPVTASLKVLNAFSLTMQQCYAFQNGTPLGKVPGTYNSSTKLYTFSGSLTPTTVGIYNYAVTCGGVESGFATLTVGDTTQTTLTAAPNPVTPPANDTLTATVTRTTGSGVPSGSVTFSSGTVVLGKASLNGSGVATLSASSKGVAAGTYPVVATYSGDTNDVGSASAAVDVSVE